MGLAAPRLQGSCLPACLLSVGLGAEGERALEESPFLRYQEWEQLFQLGLENPNQE